MNKKTYMAPAMETLSLTTEAAILNASPAGFNKHVTTTDEGGDEQFTHKKGIWSSMDDED